MLASVAPARAAPPGDDLRDDSVLVAADHVTHNCALTTTRLMLSGYHLQAVEDDLRRDLVWDVRVSLDDIEDHLEGRGLNATRVIVPVADFIASPENWLPAIAIVDNADERHFLIIWGRDGNDLRIIDPHSNQYHVPILDFAARLPIHKMDQVAGAVFLTVGAHVRTALYDLELLLDVDGACMCIPAFWHDFSCLETMPKCRDFDGMHPDVETLIHGTWPVEDSYMVVTALLITVDWKPGESLSHFAASTYNSLQQVPPWWVGHSAHGISSPDRGYDVDYLEDSPFIRYESLHVFGRTSTYVLFTYGAIILINTTSTTASPASLATHGLEIALAISKRLPTNWRHEPITYHPEPLMDARRSIPTPADIAQRQGRRLGQAFWAFWGGVALPWFVWIYLWPRSRPQPVGSGTKRATQGLVGAWLRRRLPSTTERGWTAKTTFHFVIGVSSAAAYLMTVMLWLTAMLGVPFLTVLLIVMASVPSMMILPGVLGSSLAVLCGISFSMFLSLAMLLRRALSHSLFLDPGGVDGPEFPGLARLYGRPPPNPMSFRRRPPDFDKVVISERPEAYTDVYGTERVVVIGVPLLALLDLEELRGILAHEEAHHHHFGMALLEIVWRPAASLQELLGVSRNPCFITSLIRARRKGYRYIDVLERLFRLCSMFASVMLRPMKALTLASVRVLSHRLELESDQAAAESVGASTFVAALKKATILSVAWEFFLHHWCQPTHKGDVLTEFVEFLNSGVLLELKPFIESAWHADSDRHPSGVNRAAVLGISGSSFDLNHEWLVRCDAPLQHEGLQARVLAAASNAERVDRALELVQARCGRLVQLELMDSDEFLTSVIIMLELLPPAHVLVSESRLDPVSDTVIRCLNRMVQRNLIGRELADMRISQLQKSPYGSAATARRAAQILSGIWQWVSAADVRSLAPLLGPHHLLRRESLQCSLARWQARLPTRLKLRSMLCDPSSTSEAATSHLRD